MSKFLDFYLHNRCGTALLTEDDIIELLKDRKTAHRYAIARYSKLTNEIFSRFIKYDNDGDMLEELSKNPNLTEYQINKFLQKIIKNKDYDFCLANIFNYCKITKEQFLLTINNPLNIDLDLKHIIFINMQIDDKLKEEILDFYIKREIFKWN